MRGSPIAAQTAQPSSLRHILNIGLRCVEQTSFFQCQELERCASALKAASRLYCLKKNIEQLTESQWNIKQRPGDAAATSYINLRRMGSPVTDLAQPDKLHKKIPAVDT